MVRSGFSLIEVLVSLLIFSVVAVAMLTVFTLSTAVFRETEAARAGNDEAIAVLAALEDDLRRMVPPAAGGFLFCGVHDSTGDGTADDDGGNMVLAFTIANPDASQIEETGKNARQLVAWWADKQGLLHRNTDAAADSRGTVTTTTNSAILRNLYIPTSPVAGTGCLYFAVDCHTTAAKRQGVDWSPASIPLPPGDGLGDYLCTEAFAPADIPAPFPEAIRISVVLVGGPKSGAPFIVGKENASGFVVEDLGSTIRTGGLKILPTYPNAMVRLGDPGGPVEWLTYTGFRNNRIEVAAREQRRTVHTPAVVHPRGTPIRFGRTYTLVRELPR
ncbi:MAG: prepilin-type N-terminal cleavage/methylation domain-containing protein [Planctomycetes bacterium]|nr:prepilin-type N-terminal cleavage/methylation domain-containing protein [Planctomycetota bacterium]